jgi:hypothetical protein
MKNYNDDKKKIFHEIYKQYYLLQKKIVFG